MVVIRLPTEEECKTCEFNKTIWKSQRGMLLIYSSTILALMWMISVWIEAAYKVTTDMTIPLVFAAAVGGGFIFYFDAKRKTDAINMEIKRGESMKR